MIEDPNFWPVESVLFEAFEYTQDLGYEIRHKVNLKDGEIRRLAKLQTETGLSTTSVIDNFTEQPLYEAKFYEEVTVDIGAGYVRGFGMFFSRYPTTHEPIPEYLALVTDPKDFLKVRMVSEAWDPYESNVTSRSMVLEGNKLTVITQQTRRSLLFEGPQPEGPHLQVTPLQSFTISFRWNGEGHLANWSAVLTLEDDFEDEVHFTISSHGPIFTLGTNKEKYNLPSSIDPSKAVKNILKNIPALSEEQ